MKRPRTAYNQENLASDLGMVSQSDNHVVRPDIQRHIPKLPLGHESRSSNSYTDMPDIGLSTATASQIHASLEAVQSTFQHYHVPASPNAIQGLAPQDPYFDFSTFTLPVDHGLPEGSDHWFSLDFYSALQETGWDQMLRFHDNPIPTSNVSDRTPASELVNPMDPTSSELPNPSQLGRHVLQASDHRHDQRQDDCSPSQVNGGSERTRVGIASSSDRINRAPSPPNEASYEDRLPFAWNPNSQPITEAKIIVLSREDPMLKQHNPAFDISEAKLQVVKAFLLSSESSLRHSTKDTFNLPALPVVNIFISLFFKHFAPQAPVLHEPTLTTDTDLPTPLLAIMIVIGATYSRLRHTRRFAILALDRTRRNLQLLIEDDNSLMRDPMTIYAAALVCYTGIWCGNKRAFEFGEILRGAIVTYVRRLRSHLDQQNHCGKSQNNGSQGTRLKAQWSLWIAEESRKRLFWFVYTIDSQFPCLLNLPPAMSVAEVSDWDCPCDEEFWTSNSARSWKILLGSASAPPSRSFAAAAAPFTAESCAEPSLKSGDIKDSSNNKPHFPMLHLNPWSYFLVMITIQVRVFQYAEERLLLRKISERANPPEEEGCSFPDGSRQYPQYLNMHRAQLSAVLTLWEGRYLTVPPSPHQSDPTSLFYHHASAVLCRLSSLFLNVPITDLQDAIGKSGDTGVTHAMSRASTWCRIDASQAMEVVLEAIVITDRIVRYQWYRQEILQTVCNTAAKKADQTSSEPVDTSPYNIIALFLYNIMLWTFATVSSEDQKQAVASAINNSEDISVSKPLQHIMLKGLGLAEEGVSGEEPVTDAEGPDVFLKHAATLMTRFGDWGASLNLALLLHWRSEIGLQTSA